MAWNDETENYVDTMDRELLSRRAQNVLKSLVTTYDSTTGKSTLAPGAANRTAPGFAQQMATALAGAQAANTAFTMEIPIPVDAFYGLRVAALNTRAAPPAAGLQFRVGVIAASGQTPATWVSATFNGAATPTFAGVANDHADQEQVLSGVLSLASVPRTDGGSGCLVVLETKQVNSVGGWSYISRAGSVRSADVVPMTAKKWLSVCIVSDSIGAGSDSGDPLKGYVEEACALLLNAVPIVLGWPGNAAVNYEATAIRALATYKPNVLVFSPYSPNGASWNDTGIYSRAVRIKDECAQVGTRFICAGPCVSQVFDVNSDPLVQAIRTRLAAMFGADYLDLYGLLWDGVTNPGRFVPAYYGANNYHPSAAGRAVVAAALAKMLS